MLISFLKRIFNHKQRRYLWYHYKLLVFNIKCFFFRNQYHDFLMFPFNVSKPMPPTTEEMMKKACQILDDLKISYVLADGTLLGVYRDNKLIPHDTDVDISITYPVNTKKIENELKKFGLKVGRKVMAFGRVQQLSFYSSNEDLFDVLFYTIIGKNAYCFSEKDYYFKHSAEHYNKLEPFVFKGFTFHIPQNTDKWLEHVYGEGWRTPRTSKPKDWREGGGIEYRAAVSFDGNLRKLIKEINIIEDVDK